MIYLITIFFLIIISGISEAICDIIQHKYEQSIFFKYSRFNDYFWNPLISWKNKYKSKNKFILYLKKTILVFTTDAWHLFKTLKTVTEYSIIFLLILFFNPLNAIFLILGSKLLIKLIFELFYSKILTYKTNA